MLFKIIFWTLCVTGLTFMAIELRRRRKDKYQKKFVSPSDKKDLKMIGTGGFLFVYYLMLLLGLMGLAMGIRFQYAGFDIYWIIWLILFFGPGILILFNRPKKN